jgi:hypothetical protein
LNVPLGFLGRFAGYAIRPLSPERSRGMTNGGGVISNRMLVRNPTAITTEVFYAGRESRMRRLGRWWCSIGLPACLVVQTPKLVGFFSRYSLAEYPSHITLRGAENAALGTRNTRRVPRTRRLHQMDMRGWRHSDRVRLSS